MEAPPTASHSWTLKLPFHSGNPGQQEQQQGYLYAGKQCLVERLPGGFNPTFEKQSSNGNGRRKAQECPTGLFLTLSNDGGDDDMQTIATSMIAHATASTASPEVTDDHESVATPSECTSDQVRIVDNDAANDDDFRGIGDCFGGLKFKGQLGIELHPPFDRDATANDQHHWKSLADEQDEASEHWERTSFEAPHMPGPFEPAPSLVTDCSTVESETIATHQYPIGVSALPLDNQRARPPKPCFPTTYGPVYVEETDKRRGASHPRLQEVPLGTPSQYTGQRRGGRSGRGGTGGGRGRGVTASSSTSHAHATTSSWSSSSEATGELKRRREDDEEDGDPARDDQGNREPSKRAKPNGAGKRRLACPFLRRDPKKFIHCIVYHIKTTGDLKQHLKRRHYAPIHCPVCSEVFESRALYDEHVRRQGCQQNDPTAYDISENTQKLLELPLRDPDESGRWYQIWDILFPDMKHQRPLNPFQADIWAEIWSIVCNQVHHHSPGLTHRFVGNGCSQAIAQANIREFVTWARRMGEEATGVPSVLDESHRAAVGGISGMGDSASQAPMNNTTSVQVQFGNSDSSFELLPVAESAPSHAAMPPGLSLFGSPDPTLYFPLLGYEHDDHGVIDLENINLDQFLPAEFDET
ncbi:uncharacterized protein ColSpa_08009 [Colletotrichum spaethianum]|uniref:C2H2-type domain-containing protein n=1 Tax=Colletotrichum spaethianum TaxID=700344 RepID=A0AA37P8X7_9PEZI|nr:uncharacterized protein ColSpa_08009 [Colletotrichum spaethianum]GKT47828.1 hypothetical protein ColSpa_08009 [Colletotrichum spaethianum]